MLRVRPTRASLLKRPFVAHWHTRTWTTYTQTVDALNIHSLDNTSFPYVWLRDSCPSSKCIHQKSKQKLHRTSDIPLTVAPIGEEGGVKVTSNGIDIEWNDGHKSSFDKSFLERHSSISKLMEWHLEHHLKEETWTHSSLTSNLPKMFIPYNNVLNTSSGLVQAITQLSKYGLLFISGVPIQETSNETCELRTLAGRFGEIRSTFYGPLWDVVNGNNDGKNIAYTNLDLGLHMDILYFFPLSFQDVVLTIDAGVLFLQNRYFQHPPRYQILHCLRNQVIGGRSIFVDGLQVARKLRESHPTDFDILTKIPVPFHYIVDGHHLHREHPTIELASFSLPSSEPQKISHINYSPPFQAPLFLNTPMEFYSAFARFEKMLNDPLNVYEYTLREGDVVMFDNRRVLHSRTAFRDKPGVEMKRGEINRWLKGCYLQADDLADRARVLLRD